MSNSQASGCVGGLVFLLQIAGYIFSGVVAWRMASPESFLGAIGFLILWTILACIAYGVSMLIGVILMDMFDN